MRGAVVAVALVALASACSDGSGTEPAAGATSTVPAVTGGPAADGLHALARPSDLVMGAGVRLDRLVADADFREALVAQYGSVSTINAFKWQQIEPDEVFGPDLAEADALVAFAEREGLQVRGHPLVWHREVPAWVAQQAGDEARATLRGHVVGLVEAYRGRVDAWDVVNEAVDADGALRASVWRQQLGDDYVAQAFRWAREADPDARLFYNDFGIEAGGAKADAVFALVSDLADQGLIDGVGFQVHTRPGRPLQPALTRQLRRYADLGLAVAVTEMDVRLEVPATDADLAAQADTYAAVLGACLAVPACTSFTTWGFTDRYSWIPDAYEGFGASLPFDEELRPKPAAVAMADLLRQGRP